MKSSSWRRTTPAAASRPAVEAPAGRRLAVGRQEHTCWPSLECWNGAPQAVQALAAILRGVQVRRRPVQPACPRSTPHQPRHCRPTAPLSAAVTAPASSAACSRGENPTGYVL